MNDTEALIAELRAELAAAQNKLTLREIELRQAERRAALLAAVRPVVVAVLKWEDGDDWSLVDALQRAAEDLPDDVRAWAEEAHHVG